jgi:uncharacterized alpha-E superfamily protein
MLCRVAEDVFWMSRYVERAIAVGRLIEVTWHLELDVGDVDDFWQPLLIPSTHGGFGPLEDSDAFSRQEVRHYLALDRENPSSLVSCIVHARTAARGVRECISSEMWEQLNTLYLSLVASHQLREAEADPYAFYRRVREGAQYFQGLADSTLAHDELWHFVSLGKYLERADNVARVLNLESHLLHEDQAGIQGGDPLVRWLGVLRSCGSAEAYARYYSLRVEPARVVEFLLLNPVFPQSVRFSVSAAWDALRAIAGAYGSGAEGEQDSAMRSLGRLRSRLRHRAVDEVLEEGLEVYLADVQTRIGVVSEAVTRTYLRQDAQPGRLVAVARAAMLMAAQQQQ